MSLQPKTMDAQNNSISSNQIVSATSPSSEFKKIRRWSDNKIEDDQMEPPERVLLSKDDHQSTEIDCDKVLRNEEQMMNGRERLKRHRVDMGGRVRVPDIWGQEDLLKDWIDSTAFDASLFNNSIMSACAALMQDHATNSCKFHPTNNEEKVLVKPCSQYT